jgi:hypothetical protein
MSARMGVGSWIILIVLLSLLIATAVVVYLGWTLANASAIRSIKSRTRRGWACVAG